MIMIKLITLLNHKIIRERKFNELGKTVNQLVFHGEKCFTLLVNNVFCFRIVLTFAYRIPHRLVSP